jgi:hypothetical protein
MSLWIESFTLAEAASGEVVYRPGDSNWSLDSADWLSDSRVKMDLRKYPGDHTPSSFEVVIDCETKTAEIAGSGKPPVPLRELESALRDFMAASKRART